MSEKVSVVAALAAVMEDVRAVKKTDRNTQQNYTFRGIDATVNAVGPALRKHGVVAVPLLETINYRDVSTSTGKPSRECTVTVRYRFHGPAGDYLDCVTPGESMDFGDKGAPKAMSVAYRIALLQALCLPTDETDPDSQSYERAESIGQAHGDQRPSQSAPDAARQQLLNVCEAMQLNPGTVAQAYHATWKVRLQDEQSAERIKGFTGRVRNGEVEFESSPA